MVLQIELVASDDDVAAVRALLYEYQSLLGVDLSFQDFDSEVRDLPGAYAPPKGRLLLATHNTIAVGCIALREESGTRAEMKRLFVRPGTRGFGVGKALVSRALDEARAIGYSEVVLDTLPSMAGAQRLYEQFGFQDIPAYRENPIKGTRYLSKLLSGP
jgi:putative acetyltransferase